jgi:hypothetical protein
MIMQGATHFGHAILGIPRNLLSVLQELRGASGDLAGMNNCMRLLPPRSRPVDHDMAPPNLANTPIVMQFLQAPQLLAAILSELHTSRQLIAQVHARMRWLPARGSQPLIPTLEVSPTICAVPENIASIVTELQAMRVDLSGIHSRLQILPGAPKEKTRKRSRSDPPASSAGQGIARIFSGRRHSTSDSSSQSPLPRLPLLARSQSSRDESGTPESPFKLRFLRRARSSPDISGTGDRPVILARVGLVRLTLPATTLQILRSVTKGCLTVLKL